MWCRYGAAGYERCQEEVIARDVQQRRCPQRRPGITHALCGNPSLMPPWLGSSQRVVITFSRVKKRKPSAPYALASPNSDAFQPPKEW